MIIKHKRKLTNRKIAKDRKEIPTNKINFKTSFPQDINEPCSQFRLRRNSRLFHSSTHSRCYQTSKSNHHQLKLTMKNAHMT
ncbi:unnamed protein product [Chironomus riparius]|uniref:Uncharacterized protein n=1 Tax=Chironomus riparius TaxID=315576 RepID=A0A9N9S5S2_9DIPT|nr:unnamed protein product [Chironomus riparius]